MSSSSASMTLIMTLAMTTAQDVRLSRSNDLVRIVTNPQSGSNERNMALSALAASDFEKATEIAPSLLAEGDRSLRARAAWILADGGRQSGLDVLRAMAGERTEESVIAISMLGRLRDPGSHELLVGLLEQELASPNQQGSFPDVPASDSIIAALSGALADYGDKRDTALLIRTIPGKVGSGHWVMIEQLGRAGGKEAIPVLENAFDHAPGWTRMASGLGLARCGSAKGLKYIRERLADTSGDRDKPNESRTTNAQTDSPYGPKATDFILTHLGVPADEVLVPELLRILSSPEYSGVHRAQAWGALSRMNPARERETILELAWKNLTDTSAVRLVVFNDDVRARTVAAQLESSKDGKERAAGRALRRALAETPRERRRWREFHGYVE